MQSEGRLRIDSLRCLAVQALTVYVVVLSLCSVIVTNNICPEAVGGGIPDVKVRHTQTPSYHIHYL